jgi:trigger factor
MGANVEELGALERRLDVSIPQEKIRTEVESRLKRLARTAKIHGFRPGKFPLKIVQQQYGPQVRQEVIGDELKELVKLCAKEPQIAGYPRFEQKISGECL